MVRKKVPLIPDDDVIPKDALAKKEASAFASGTYDEESKKSEHLRSEWAKWVLHWAAVLIFLQFVVVYMILLLVWAFSLIAPDKYRYLTDCEFDKVQAIVLSGVVASALSRYYERYMK